VPVVANNVISALNNQKTSSRYDGYGSCPLIVERGKIVLAEFIYEGKQSQTFPKWFNDGTQATSIAWYIKSKLLPFVYWHQMLKGVEWLVKPKRS